MEQDATPDQLTPLPIRDPCGPSHLLESGQSNRSHSVKTLVLAIMLFVQGTPLPNGVVTGQIQPMTGASANGVRVFVMTTSNSAAPDAGFSAFDSITETDSSGKFRLERVPPGRYIVGAGLVDSPTYYPGVK